MFAEILEQLAQKGYAGGKDLASVKAYIASENLKFTDDSGEAVDLDAEYKAFEAAQKKAETVLTVKRATEKARQTVENTTTTKGVQSVNAAPAIHANATKSARARYDARVKTFQNGGLSAKTPMFACSDDAELFAASMRLAVAGVHGKQYSQHDNDLAIVKTMGGLDPTAGGTFVIPEATSSLIYNTEPSGVWSKTANVVTMARDVWSAPRKTGIVSMSHVAASGTISASDNTTDMVELVAKKAGVIIKAQREWFDDAAVNVADDFSSTFIEARDRRIDADWILGDGTSTYGGHVGLVSALPSGAYTNASGGTWASITESDIYGVIGKLQYVKDGRIAIVCSRQFYNSVLMRIDGTRSGTTLTEKNAMARAAFGAQAMFGVYPVYFSDQMPTATASTSKVMYVGDFVGGSMIGLREGIFVDQSKDAYWTTDEIGFKATARFAVNIHGDGRGGTVGPIACLQTT